MFNKRALFYYFFRLSFSSCSSSSFLSSFISSPLPPFLQTHDFNYSSHPTSLSPAPPFCLSFLSFSLSFPSSQTVRCLLSGDLADSKCLFLFRCRWDCNKACQWEAWVALSHAFCFPSILPLIPSPATPLIHAFFPLSDFSAVSSPILFPSHPKTVLIDFSLMSLSLSLVSLPTALSGTQCRRAATGDTVPNVTTVYTRTHHVNISR